MQTPPNPSPSPPEFAAESDEGFGEEIEICNLNEESISLANKWRSEMLEKLSLYSDELLEKIIEDKEIGEKEINKIGQFPITINLHSDLIAELRVSVEKKTLKK